MTLITKITELQKDEYYLIETKVKEHGYYKVLAYCTHFTRENLLEAHFNDYMIIEDDSGDLMEDWTINKNFLLELNINHVTLENNPELFI